MAREHPSRPDAPGANRRRTDVRGPAARGIGLVEALLAMLALSLALGALLHLQSLLGDSAEHDRLRLEALAVAQSLHEALRQGDPALASRSTAPAELPLAPGLQLQTRDLPADMPGLRQRHTTVRWPPRRGWPARLDLVTLLPADPVEADALGAALLLQRATAWRGGDGTIRPLPRHRIVPPDAVPLGDGRSAWQPRADLPAVWLLDDDSGAVLALCGGLTVRPDGLRQTQDCVALGGLPISGTIRFATDTDFPGPAEAESPLSPAWPVSVVIRAATPTGIAPRSTCVTDAPTRVPQPGEWPLPGQVRYLCVVVPSGNPPRWSGRLDLVPIGWTIGSSNSQPPAPPVFRVCRYSADHDHNGRIDNAEHPPVYLDVDGPLGNQNFLVVRGSAACPTDRPADRPTDLLGMGGLNWLDHSTQPHQPP